MRIDRRRPPGFGVALAFALTLSIGSAGTAFANDTSGQYGSEGYWKAATTRNSYNLNVASTHCNSGEINAFGAINTSTRNAGGTFGQRWSSGITISQKNCTGYLSKYIDIQIVYSNWSTTHPGQTSGGMEHSNVAVKSYCDAWLVNYPCGQHASIVEINDPKYHSTGYNRPREIMALLTYPWVHQVARRPGSGGQ